MNYRRIFGGIIGTIGILGSIIIVLTVGYIVVVLIFIPEKRADILSIFTIGNSAENFTATAYKPRMTQSDQDELSVVPDHRSITLWVQSCMGVEPGSDVPPILWNIFRLPHQSWGIPAAPGKYPEGVRAPSHAEQQLMQLSSALSEQRLSLITHARNSFFYWQLTTIIIIAIGMLTTIIVSVSSTEFGRGDGRTQRAVRLSAIVLPALGTAAAAVSAFYSPQTEWSQAARSLASETQLHGQIVLGIWKIACPKSPDDGDAKKLADALEDWSKRYLDIQTISAATGAATGSQGNKEGNSGNQTGPGATGGQAPGK